MKVNELITQLQGLDPDADVQVLTEQSEYVFNFEDQISEEITYVQWQPVAGVEVVGTIVKLYGSESDLEAP